MREKERYVILYEDMLSKFDILIDGHQVLKDMMEKNTDRLNQRINETNAMLRLMVDALNQKIEDDKKDLIETKQELKAEIQGVKHDLGKKIDRVVDRLENHEMRIVVLEEAA